VEGVQRGGGAKQFNCFQTAHLGRLLQSEGGVRIPALQMGFQGDYHSGFLLPLDMEPLILHCECVQGLLK